MLFYGCFNSCNLFSDKIASKKHFHRNVNFLLFFFFLDFKQFCIIRRKLLKNILFLSENIFFSYCLNKEIDFKKNVF